MTMLSKFRFALWLLNLAGLRKALATYHLWPEYHRLYRRIHGLQPRKTIRARISARYHRHVRPRATRLWQAVTPFRYVNTYRRGQARGGPEEGGWWYDTYDPIGSRRSLWFRAGVTPRDIQESRDGQRNGGYTFGPSSADHDPAADYTDGDLVGATYHDGRTSLVVERHPARATDTYSPWC